MKQQAQRLAARLVPKSLLFVPGSRRSMLEKCLVSKPHAFVPDMEDSVPIELKDEARQVKKPFRHTLQLMRIAEHKSASEEALKTSSFKQEFLPKLKATGRLVVPRVNGLDTGLTEADISAVVSRFFI